MTSILPEPTDSPTASNAAYWQGRAEEAHAVAALMLDPVAKATMLDLAAMYLAMARRAAERRARPVAGLGVSLRTASAN